MEPRFKTSFIPKKSFEQPAPIQARGGGSKGGTLGLLGVAGIVIFAIAGISAGGVYFYRFTLESSIEDKAKQLEEAREAFNPALIQLMNRLDTRLKTANQLLDNHVAVSAIFPLIEANTYRDVQFNDLTLVRDNTGNVAIAMTGEARDFDVVALQSDLFGANRDIVNPVFEDLDVVAQDRVSFSVRSTINPQRLLYVNRVSAGDYAQQEDIPLPVPDTSTPATTSTTSASSTPDDAPTEPDA